LSTKAPPPRSVPSNDAFVRSTLNVDAPVTAVPTVNATCVENDH
jgi:hypothetical protein